MLIKQGVGSSAQAEQVVVVEDHSYFSRSVFHIVETLVLPKEKRLHQRDELSVPALTSPKCKTAGTYCKALETLWLDIKKKVKHKEYGEGAMCKMVPNVVFKDLQNPQNPGRAFYPSEQGQQLLLWRVRDSDDRLQHESPLLHCSFCY